MAARPFPRRLASLLVGLLASSAAIETDELAQRLKLALWQRAVPECGVEGCSTNAEELPELLARWTCAPAASASARRRSAFHPLRPLVPAAGSPRHSLSCGCAVERMAVR